MSGPGLDAVWEAEGEVSKRHDGVGPDDWVWRLLEDGEQQLQVVFAVLGAKNSNGKVT